jgi:hypothetical protein
VCNSQACFWTSSGTLFSIHPCHILGTSTCTDLQTARTIAISSPCLVPPTLRMRGRFVVCFHDPSCTVDINIKAMTIQPGALPDEGLIFDSLFARQKFNPSPNKVSSIFFDWASLIIHGEPPTPTCPAKSYMLTVAQISFRQTIVTSAFLRPPRTWICLFSTEMCKKNRII